MYNETCGHGAMNNLQFTIYNEGYADGGGSDVRPVRRS